MRIVFFGTPSYVLPILESLQKGFKEFHESSISAVVTRKPKPSGRKRFLKYSEIDQWAHDRNKPKFYSSSEIIENDIRADVGVLAAYGEIIPKEVIDHFPHGILNIHPSLLPEFRGASPVQATLVSGKKKANVSIIKMDEELDHGPIVSQFAEEIKEADTTETLRDRLFLKSAGALTTLIPAYLEGKISLRKQDHQKATFTKLIRKKDAYIDPKALDSVLKGKDYEKEWALPFITNYTTHYLPTSVHNFIRAMQPWPQAWTLLRLDSSGQAKRLKLLSSRIEKRSNQETKQSTDVFVLDEVQLEGKTPVFWKQFKKGYPEAKF